MTALKSLTLYVIRHGECEHNAGNWTAGHDDSPLTQRGREQARAAGVLLKELAGDLSAFDFYASSLHRTCVTMELLRKAAGLPPTGYRADRRLMEGNLGDHSRQPRDEMLAHPEFVADPWNYIRPDGESRAMIHARIGRFLETLTRDCVIVTHYQPVVMLRAHCLGLSPEQAIGYHMANASILRLTQGTEALFEN